MSYKKALITGITGQDGAVLAAILLEKGYKVFGLRPYLPVDDTEKLYPVLADIELLYGDLSDTPGLIRALERVRPDEIYNLAAMSHVQVSFTIPEATMDINATGPLRLLEAMRAVGMNETRFYQASSSEMYGNAPAPQNEDTPFMPCNPYGVAKLAAYWLVRLYRDAYGFHASNGILFNHESGLRGEQFVTRKITRAAGEFRTGRTAPLLLGNMDARRDWGHARDYMMGAWQMLQQARADDYVLATGQTRSVRDFASRAFACAGYDIVWQGEGMNETGHDKTTGAVMVRIDPALYRPLEVECLCGDAAKARRVLGWTPATSFEDLVAEMVEADMPAFAARKRYA